MDTEIRSGTVKDVTTRIEAFGRSSRPAACFVLDNLPVHLVVQGRFFSNAAPPSPFLEGEKVFVIGKADPATGRFEADFAHVPGRRCTIGGGGVMPALLLIFLIIIVRLPVNLLVSHISMLTFGTATLMGLGLAVVLLSLPAMMLWTGIARIRQRRLLEAAAHRG